MGGLPTFYSYRTCGYPDTYATMSCANRTVEECKEDPDCTLRSNPVACVPAERKLFVAQTLWACNGTEEVPTRSIFNANEIKGLG